MLFSWLTLPYKFLSGKMDKLGFAPHFPVLRVSQAFPVLLHALGGLLCEKLPWPVWRPPHSVFLCSRLCFPISPLPFKKWYLGLHNYACEFFSNYPQPKWERGNYLLGSSLDTSKNLTVRGSHDNWGLSLLGSYPCSPILTFLIHFPLPGLMLCTSSVK